MFFSVPMQICQLLRFHEMDIRSWRNLFPTLQHPKKSLRCCIWYPHGAVDPEAIWGTGPVDLEVGRCQFGIPVSPGPDLMGRPFRKPWSERDATKNWDDLSISWGKWGGGVMFSKVSVKIRTFDSIFFRTKVSMFFFHTHSFKETKKHGIPQDAMFLGYVFFNIKCPGKSFPHPPKNPWKKRPQPLRKKPGSSSSGPERSLRGLVGERFRRAGCQPGSLQGGFHSHWELCSDVSLVL